VECAQFRHKADVPATRDLGPNSVCFHSLDSMLSAIRCTTNPPQMEVVEFRHYRAGDLSLRTLQLQSAYTADGWMGE